MERNKNTRDIKKEMQDIKDRAKNEYSGKDIDTSANDFIDRATKFPSREEKTVENHRDTSNSLRKKLTARVRPERIYNVERGNISANVKLEDAVSGNPEQCGSASFYRIIDSVSAVDPDAENLIKRYREILSSPFKQHIADIAPMSILGDLPIENVCYLDLETTGLSNSPLFLVGLMYSREGSLVLDQFFARDYTEEEPLLESACNFLKNFSAVVTFNGKAFDIPFMLDRMKVFGIDSSMPEYHVDLLPISKRIVGKRTPNHKLSTLEADLLGRKRIGDVPGRVIPELYHDYVRTGNAADIAGIIKHNRIDLISLMRLIVFFLSDLLNLEGRN